ncbi:2-C-methyl-D-erythritol 2,4-cyclodiphosphate synthase [Francisella tularensis]|uniref:2-C-methyl-D-erythritol 2,4-cyclodiphosphate synthase n=1 Tax=Francisella tularensis subsp. holarctica (strain OSU18) TaxID=393011 RepID=ISPF_FRATO|nr:2-C-methyl-D-erythritol 2,4-cyclodiphosphate synthase [Francisella tularensis]Q0BMD2.1 RecName: Full=2-C-methyl-D-erythritol 2,4-cyclodiphosphate synthase; Short=MECDP-synthase; Short=MECPP-synthase; Short=MECPS [Francisella tularensis subsp. holarctica OSU18]ABI82752.1 2-C-methyl-D-erythritol 2,4-cyclodiphosphate synthase [Francisella tularensis subsp. holarctica OSU18]AJI50215.1 2-C-methyl-D-erythritol 2,4-cyclodiphosphate synthase [Francisella tularensis subsp. holarctica]AJI65679.1 2-C-m
MSFRIGHGYDVHKFTSAKQNIIIGGVEIAYHLGLEAHSDGDVLIHALCDAIIGALGLGDIGKHFLDTDNQFKNIDSKFFLAEIKKMLDEKQYSISNIDCTIIAQAPKMLPHIEKMRACLANILEIQISQINIKATTTERLGFIGREEGIATHVVCLLYR